jgi:hypothetical protein
VLADLRRDDELVAVAAQLLPLADEALRVTTGVAGDPRRVAVGGVDEVAAARDERVEDVERGLPVGRPPEHVAAEVQREDGQVGRSEGGAGVSHLMILQRFGSGVCLSHGKAEGRAAIPRVVG